MPHWTGAIHRPATVLAIVVMASGCNFPTPTPGPKNSALYLNSSITPAPVVDLPVVWHIEAGVDPAYGRTFPSTLFVNLPSEIEIVAGDRTWEGDLPFEGTQSMDLVIRVLKPGIYEVSAQATTGDPGSTLFGASQSFIIESSTTSAKVSDILTIPLATVETLRAGTATPTP